MGDLHFLADGTLLVGNGDGADAAFADPLALRAQDLNSTNGKILRINKDGTAPADNPFFDGTKSARSKVWLYGVRNPFRDEPDGAQERRRHGRRSAWRTFSMRGRAGQSSRWSLTSPTPCMKA